jgi:ribosome-associated protein
MGSAVMKADLSAEDLVGLLQSEKSGDSFAESSGADVEPSFGDGEPKRTTTGFGQAASAKDGEEASAAPTSRARSSRKGKIRRLQGQDLAALVAAAASEHKVVSPTVLDLSGLSSVADYFYVASADNPRQIKSIAEKIVRRAKEAGIRPLGEEGLNQAETRWALIDFGEVIAHIFLAEARALYDLEGLWGDAPKLAVSDRGKIGRNDNGPK